MWKSKDFEKYAITTLGFFYDEYKHMKKTEHPDYSNGEIGVEITQAITTTEGEMDGFWRKNKGKKYEELSKRQLKKLGFSDSFVPTSYDYIFYLQRSSKKGRLVFLKNKGSNEMTLLGFLGGFETNESTEEKVISSISEKTKKLNSHYQEHSKYDLCIIIREQLNYYLCQEEIISELLDSLMSSIRKEYDNCNEPLTFDDVFLLFLDNLFRINSKTWKVEKHTITQVQIDEILAQIKS